MNELGFIHRYVAGSGQSGRLLLLLHGTGGDEADLLPLGRELDGEAALLSPRGQVSENGMPRFFRRLAEGVFDEEDLVRRANELADFVVGAAHKYRFDLSNMTAVGYSNGANIAAAILLLWPEILHAAILFRAMVPLSTPAIPDLTKTRVLIGSGSVDPLVPLENSRRLASLLREGGANVSLEIQQASHGLIAEDVTVARRWLQQ